MLLHQKKNHYLRVGLVMTALITLLAVVGAFWTPYEPTAIAGGAKFAAPSLGHLFGTDNFGRDIFSRVMCGVGTTFFIALGTILLGAGVGILIGAFTGYFGGVVDETLMRINDAITAFPSILLALVFIALLGFGKYNVILALGIAFVPSYARVVRGRIRPPPGDELCQIRPADGRGTPAHHVRAHPAEHAAGHPADACHRV